MIARMAFICIAFLTGLATATSKISSEVRGERTLSVEATGRIRQNAEDMIRKTSKKAIVYAKTHVSAFASLGRYDRYAHHHGISCSTNSGGHDIDTAANVPRNQTLAQCQSLCKQDDECTCVNYEAMSGICRKQRFCYPEICASSLLSDVYVQRTVFSVKNASDPRHDKFERTGGRACGVPGASGSHATLLAEQSQPIPNKPVDVTRCLRTCLNTSGCDCVRYERAGSSECVLMAGCAWRQASLAASLCTRSERYDMYLRYLPTDAPTNAPTEAPTDVPIPVLFNLTTSDIIVGSDWIDHSGNGNDAVPRFPNGSIVNVTGQSGEFYTFNGSGFPGRDDYDPQYMYVKNIFFESKTITALELYVELRTSYNGTEVGTNIGSGQRHANWAILDFDKSDWFTAYLRGDTHTATFDCRHNFGVLEHLHGGPPLNDGVWHSVKFTFKVTASCDAVFEIVVDGTVVKTLTSQSWPLAGLGFESGIGYANSQKRFGIIADGSEASVENGKRNDHFFDGDLRAMTLKASTVPTTCR